MNEDEDGYNGPNKSFENMFKESKFKFDNEA